MADTLLTTKFEWEDLDIEFEKLEQQITGAVRGMTVEFWHAVLESTPQFYGRLVSSWSYTLNTPHFVDRSAAAPGVRSDIPRGERNVFQKGDPEAISVANGFNVGAELPFKLGDVVWIANGADHGEGPYSSFIENVNDEYLRPVNRPGHNLARTVAGVWAKFEDGVSASQAERLRTLRIGA